jgi:hypothetical protein
MENNAFSGPLMFDYHRSVFPVISERPHRKQWGINPLRLNFVGSGMESCNGF